jgi:hypothetical protein
MEPSPQHWSRRMLELSVRRESPIYVEVWGKDQKSEPPFRRVWGKNQKSEPLLEECGARPVSAGGEVEVWWWRRNRGRCLRKVNPFKIK